jgi:hypothetical protein
LNNIVILSYSGSLVSISQGEKRSAFKEFVVDTVKEIFDIKMIFQNWKMLVISISNFFVMLGYFVPFIYIPKVNELNKIEGSSSVFAVIGIDFKINSPILVFFILYFKILKN